MWHSLFPCQPGAASEISLILAKSKGIVYNEHRKSTHSKADAPKRDYLPLNERRLSCGPDRRGIIFFACSSYLCRERQATPQSSFQRTSAEPIFHPRLLLQLLQTTFFLLLPCIPKLQNICNPCAGLAIPIRIGSMCHLFIYSPVI